MEAKNVLEVNDDMEAGFIAEQEAELDTDEVAVLTKPQKADLEKTARECELKLKEVKSLIQEALWDNSGDELSTALQAAETE